MHDCHSWSFHLLVASALIWSAGCGAPTERIPVSGSVLVGGNALDNAAITFLPLSTTAAPAVSTGVTRGRYQFTEQNGPIPGKYRVTVRLSPPCKNDPPVATGSAVRQSWDNEVEVPTIKPCEIDLELN